MNMLQPFDGTGDALLKKLLRVDFIENAAQLDSSKYLEVKYWCQSTIPLPIIAAQSYWSVI